MPPPAPLAWPCAHLEETRVPPCTLLRFMQQAGRLMGDLFPASHETEQAF